MAIKCPELIFLPNVKRIFGVYMNLIIYFGEYITKKNMNISSKNQVKYGCTPKVIFFV